MRAGRRLYEYDEKKLNIKKILIISLVVVILIIGIALVINSGTKDKEEKNIEGKIIEEIEEVKEKSIDDIISEFGGEIEEKVKNDTYYVLKDGEEYTAYSDGEIVKGKIVPWDGTSREPASDSSGNIDIFDPAELKWVADKVINGEKNFSGVTINLRNNLDFGARKNENGEWSGNVWTPIIGFLDELPKNEETVNQAETPEILVDDTIEVTQESLKRFAGIFNGNNFYIRGLYVNSEKKYQGLFGYQTGIINGVNIKNSAIYGKDTVGAIVGLNGGTVQNCSIKNVEVKGIEKVGGLVGNSMTSSTITSCISEGENNLVTGEKYVGGLVGYLNNNTSLYNSINNTNVTGKQYVGGITGIVFYGTVLKNSTNMAKNVIGEEYVGGIAGYSQAQLENVSNHTLEDTKGIVSGKNYVGGLVGVNHSMGNIINSYNSGKIITEKDNCGGIVGLNNANISNCYNIGEIDASESDSTKVGGICGQNVSESFIYSAYNIGKVKVKAICGGVIGANFGTSSNCFYLDSSIPDKIAKTDEAKSESEMKSGILENLGVDYKEDTENINSGYPILIWQNATKVSQ